MISLGTSSIADSARTRVSGNELLCYQTALRQVMSFMAGQPSRRNFNKTRGTVVEVARERIDLLIHQARQTVEKNEGLSKRYVDLARRISERTKVRIPRETKRYLCKTCGIIMVPGRNARVRLYAGTGGIVITCLSCGTFRRYPVSRRKEGIVEGHSMKPYIVQSEPSSKKKFQKDLRTI